MVHSSFLRRCMTIAVLAALTTSTAFAQSDSQDDNSSPAPLTKEEIARRKALRAIESQLGRLRPPAPHKKSLEDYFLVAKVEVTQEDRAAKVQFGVIQGQEKAAQEIYDHVAGANSQTLRNWRVFARYHDSQGASEGLQAIRNQYDQLVAYREQLMRAYQAATMCRT